MERMAASLSEYKRMVEFNIQTIQNNLDFYEQHFFDESPLANEYQSLSHPRKLCQELKQWRELLEKIKREIWSGCVHEFVSDYVDVDVEKTVPISYCSVCYMSLGEN